MDSPPSPVQQPVQEPLREPLRMLIVDDDRVTRVLLAGLARSLGFHATCVGTADKALALATRDGYGLILMDCLLPGRDGYAAARALRAAGVRTPVVAVTSTCDEAACHAAGMDYFISKPVTRADLRLACEFLQIPLSATAAHGRRPREA